MDDYGKCSLCKGKYEFVDTRQINESEYHLVKCKKCGHEVAKQIN